MSKSAALENRFQQPPNWQWGTIVNQRGMALRYGGLAVEGQPATAHVVFVEGLNGFAEETFELSRTFNKQAQGFWVIDRAGQGLSDRYRWAQQKMHAADFSNDAQDLIEMVKATVPKDGAPIFLFAHSTGALMALEAAHEAPEMFSGVILSAPLTGLNHPVIRNRESYVAGFPLKRLFLETVALPGFPGTLRKEQGTTEKFSSDPARNKLRDWWRENNPKLRTGPLTMGWLWEACRAINRVIQPSYLQEIYTPTLIFTAEKDFLINNEKTQKLASSLPHATHIHLPEAKHELFLETDNIRNILLRKSQEFIRQHTTPPPPKPAL